MTRLIYDIETDGLLHEMTQVHCIITMDADTHLLRLYTDSGVFPEELPIHGSIADGVAALNAADERIGHNIVCFDEVALERYGLKRRYNVLDTMVGCRVLWPDEHLESVDYANAALGKDPIKNKMEFGRQSLKVWGKRLGVEKFDFGKEEDAWKVATVEMVRYCAQDVRVTQELFALVERKMKAGLVSRRALTLENEFAFRISQQMDNGFPFNKEAAMALAGQLSARRAELADALAKKVPPFEDEYITPKKKIRKTRVTLFNPGSRPHVIRHLRERHGWVPTVFTDGGAPKLDADVLDTLELEGIEDFKEYFKLVKILGMLAEGKQSWLNKVKPDGRIHGYVNHNATPTSRCSHNSPNVTQVSKVEIDKTTKKPKLGYDGGFGYECRGLFHARDGWVLVGGDASGLELRMLAHYMAEFDAGEYALVVCSGDVHQKNADALGARYTRDDAKRFIYAFLYGAGIVKLAKVLRVSTRESKATKIRFLHNLPALKRVISHTKTVAKKRRLLLMPDGRYLHVRYEHASLNTRLQGLGAIVMKLACVLAHRILEEKGFRSGVHYAQVHQAHDELQFECQPEIATQVGQAIVDGIRIAGEKLKLRCPLTGEYKIGKTWAETH